MTEASAAGLASVLVSIDGPIARLTLNRPEAMNCFDDEMAGRLLDGIAACARDPSLRVLILSANGRTFSGGGDLRFITTTDIDGARRMITRMHEAIFAMAKLPIFTVLATRGAAGIGLSLVAGADFVVSSENAGFVAAYTAAGLSPDGGLSYFLPRVAGSRRARRMIVFNEPLDAEAGLACGLIDRIVPDEDLDAETTQLAMRIARGPASALAKAKRLLATDLDELQRHLDHERASIIAQFAHREAKEGTGAFLERRAPDFMSVGDPAISDPSPQMLSS